MPNCDDQLDAVFHALADGNRRKIIDRLSQGDLSVSELSAPLGISLPATLQHIGVLEAAGLVATHKAGRVRSCSLDRTALSQAEIWINERRQFWSERLDALGDLLASSGETENSNGGGET
ncbi:ArsR/SmtB family transcription factor [Roseibium sp.]|uniref:ArsR/SmtB family transcription factor n=1 Tax=Roseibium sp. TaxID=1936156 RepID=UPI003A975B06